MLNTFYINQCSSSNSPEAMCYFYFSLSGKELQIIVKVSISGFYLCGSQQIHIDLFEILWPFSFTVLTLGIIFALKLSLSYIFILTLSLKLWGLLMAFLFILDCWANPKWLLPVWAEGTSQFLEKALNWTNYQPIYGVNILEYSCVYSDVYFEQRINSLYAGNTLLCNL